MSNEYLRLNDTKLNIKRAENLLAKIGDKRKDEIEGKEVQSKSSLFKELWQAFKNFFSKLGEPTLTKRLQKNGAPAKSSDYNNTMKEICDDIKVAYVEEDSLSSVMVKNFNYSEAERQSLISKVRKLNSKSIDYSFYAEGVKTNSIYAIDSFMDNSKIDYSKISPGAQPAELVINQGAMTLNRLSNSNKAPLVEKVTGIQESIPEWDPANEVGGYEGLYFGLRNGTRPEGGRWHVDYSIDGGTVYELGAPEEELMPIRLQMFDDNPETYWEVEKITKPIVGYVNKYSGAQISVAEFNELINNEVSSSNVEVVGDTVVTDRYGSLIEDYVPLSNTGVLEYLTVNFTVHLDTVEMLNWISLNPNNFGQENYVQVLSIQTSDDGQAYTELEGFDDHEYDITLTSEANSELTPNQVRDTLAPDQFKYAGQGIWVFAPRKVKDIKFTVRQPRSYLQQYEVLMVEVSQTVTTTTTKKKWYGKSSTSSDVQTVKKEIEIPYIVGHITGFDVMDLEPGESDMVANDSTPIVMVAGAAIGAVFGGPIGALIGGAIGSLFGSSKKVSTSVGPQEITRQWTKLKDDRARFAIGIRDINLYSYNFAETSEFVSTPYLSPKPISKLALTINEQIPREFYSGDLAGRENDWIKYYVSIDDGTSWHRISPQHHRSVISDDGVNFVPEIININSDVGIEERKNPLAYIDYGVPVYSARFKAVFSRPKTIENSDSYTPVLLKYALQMYPLGGL